MLLNQDLRQNESNSHFLKDLVFLRYQTQRKIVTSFDRGIVYKSIQKKVKQYQLPEVLGSLLLRVFLKIKFL